MSNPIGSGLLLIGLFLLTVIVSPSRAWSASKHPLATISKETTYITEPLRLDGYPDYLAAKPTAEQGALRRKTMPPWC